MSISSEVSRVGYVGNGAVNTYDYTFRIFQAQDLLVVVRNTNDDVQTTLALTTDYTVTGVKDEGGGTIVLVDSGQDWIDGGNLSADYIITIRRLVDITQTTDIRNQGDFFAEVHEDTFDTSRMIDQQQQDEIDRSIKLPESVPASSFDINLPTDIVGKIEQAVITNETGDGFRMGPTAGEIENAEQYANEAAASAAAAAVSETNAAASEAAAAQSAIDAANAVEAAQWTDVRFITNADSPVNVVESDSGTMFSVDPSGGPIVFNLPVIASMSDINPWSIGIKKSVFTDNDITVNRGGSDDIDDGQTSVDITTFNSGKIFIPDTDPTPDNWTTIGFGEAYFEQLTLEELATDPTTPASGNVKVYAKNDSLAYIRDSSGAVTQLGALPPGILHPFAGSTSPTGYLLCDGTAVSRTTYSGLFAAIGTTYGVGDGSTTFNLPDMRGRVPAGRDDMGGAAANRITNGGSGITGTNLGAAGGTETHTMTIAEMPAHTHTFNLHADNPNWLYSAGVTGSIQNTASTNSTGGGGPHQNTQPTMIMNYIIKT